MAQAKKCDRCGTFYAHYPTKDQPDAYNAIMRVRVDGSGTRTQGTDYPIDLCPECMDEFRDFMKEYELQK